MTEKDSSGFLVNHKSVGLFLGIAAALTLGWHVTQYFQWQAFRIDTLEKDRADQETMNAQILHQSREINKTLIDQIRAIDRLTFEVENLKGSK